MPQDWKQQYLNDERQQQEARRAKLAKLDLDINPENKAKSAANPTRPPLQRREAPQPVQHQSAENTASPGVRTAQPPRNRISQTPAPEGARPKPQSTEAVPIVRVSKRKVPVGRYIARGAAVFFTAIFLVVYAVFALCFVIAKGPSESARNLAVQSALQASATKWVPGLFLDDETIAEIKEAENAVIQDVVSLDDYVTSDESSDTDTPEDPWANAIDGMLYETVSGSTYKAYVLLVKDPGFL